MSSKLWQGHLRHQGFPAILGVHGYQSIRKLRHVWEGEVTGLLKGFGVPGGGTLAKAISLTGIPSGTPGHW